MFCFVFFTWITTLTESTKSVFQINSSRRKWSDLTPKEIDDKKHETHHFLLTMWKPRCLFLKERVVLIIFPHFVWWRTDRTYVWWSSWVAFEIILSLSIYISRRTCGSKAQQRCQPWCLTRKHSSQIKRYCIFLFSQPVDQFNTGMNLTTKKQKRTRKGWGLQMKTCLHPTPTFHL